MTTPGAEGLSSDLHSIGAQRQRMSCFARSWVLITSGSVSPDSICVSFTPGGTTASGLPGSAPTKRPLVCSSLAHAACAGLLSSQLMNTLAALGCGARFSSHTTLPATRSRWPAPPLHAPSRVIHRRRSLCTVTRLPRTRVTHLCAQPDLAHLSRIHRDREGPRARPSIRTLRSHERVHRGRHARRRRLWANALLLLPAVLGRRQPALDCGAWRETLEGSFRSFRQGGWLKWMTKSPLYDATASSKTNLPMRDRKSTRLNSSH